MLQTLTIRRPDDFHCHLRDRDAALARTVPDLARQCARALIMPNTRPPILTATDAISYHDRILRAYHDQRQATTTLSTPTHNDFTPLMSLYLTDHSTPAMIEVAAKSGVVVACKLYPAHATTHSEHGVTDLSRLDATLAAMADHGLLLLVHGEVTDPTIDIFDREAVFIEQVLAPLIQRHPTLRVVLEHVSTQVGIDFVTHAPDTVAATLTAHHLWLNRNDLLVGGLKPHHYCLPVVKRQRDQAALIHAAISGNPKFFLGTDSAPHRKNDKLSACGCAGIYTGYHALPLYAEIFDQYHALDKLEAFASEYGARFYGLPLNTGTLCLVKQPWQVPNSLPFDDDVVIPFRAGEHLNWQVQD